MIAIDAEKTTMRTTATVTINILDMNDNSPIFPHDTYKITLPEHSDVGTEVGVITVCPVRSL